MENDISVVSFIYNEEINIDRWLSSLKPYVKEIVLFDLESTDSTFELCQKYTDKVYRRPYLLCGDYYKIELQQKAKSDWLLWTYPDEQFSDSALQTFSKLLQHERWNAYSFMRHEYLDDIRVCYKDNDGRILAFGTPESPNYQCRLHKNDGRIFYTEMVHNELNGEYRICNLPPEYYIEHFKSSASQEFDNIRLYILYQASIFKYGKTQVSEYKKHIDSYRKIIHDSEVKNLSGERGIHLGEEFWWNWRKYANMKRLTLEEFKNIMGMEYKDFLKSKSEGNMDKFVIDNNIVDPILKINNE